MNRTRISVNSHGVAKAMSTALAQALIARARTNSGWAQPWQTPDIGMRMAKSAGVRSITLNPDSTDPQGQRWCNNYT